MAARTNVPLTALSANAGVTEPAGTTVDPTNGHNVLTASKLGTSILIVVNNTHATLDKTTTIKAGVNPPAFRKDLGDLVVTVTALTKAFIGPLESARFVQADGSINIDLQAGITGTIYVLSMPFHSV